MGSLNCNCEILTRINNIKYLSVVIDDKLTWAEHIFLMAGPVRKLMFIFKNIRILSDTSR